MFKKKAVEQELARASETSAKLEEYQKAIEAIENSSESAIIELDQIGMSATRMDGSLTRVVDYARESMELTREDEEKLATVSQKMTAQFEKEEELCRKYQSLATEFMTQKNGLDNLMDQSKHYTDITKSLSELTGGYLQGATTLLEETARMKEYGTAIGVLSLNAAIEAGRLGESGTEYIKAAEEIRDYAGHYDASTDAVMEMVENMKGSYEKTADQLHQLIVLLRENNILLGKLTTNSIRQCDKLMQLEEDVSRGGTGEGINHGNAQVEAKEFMDDMRQQLAALQKNGQIVLSAQKQILGEMESVGSCFMEEQESTEKLESSFASIKGVLSDLG